MAAAGIEVYYNIAHMIQFDRSAEQSKWDSYFEDLPFLQEDDCTARFNAELVEAVAALLPDGGRTLEAGCGAAWQSLALARHAGFQASLGARFECTLLDFSPKALEYARRVFERENLPAPIFLGPPLASVPQGRLLQATWRRC